MKKIFLRATMSIVLLAGVINIMHAASVKLSVVDESDASLVSVVKKYYPNDSIEMYLSKDKYAKGDTIKLMGGEMFTIPYDCRVVFTDMEPYANWSHTCEYLLISTDTEQMSVFKNDMPPAHLLDLFALLQRGKYMRGQIVKPQNTSANKGNKNIQRRTHSVTNTKYAVIINGGGEISQNYVRYWNECSAMYMTLIAHGYSRDNIFVAMSDGTDPDVDYLDENMQPASSPLDLDGDGNDDIQYAATRDNVENIFNELANIMTGDDDLFIFMTGHGDYKVRPPHYTPYYEQISFNWYILWGENEKIIHNEFPSLLEPIQARSINIVMGQNYSGGFIDALRTPINEGRLNNIVFTAVCGYNETAGCLNNGNYGEFIFHWLSGVNGFAPGTMQPISDTADDIHQDGFVSMEEAYYYADSHRTSYERPLQEAHPYCLAPSLALDALLDYCDGSFLISGWDLYMKDNPLDMGEEPNQTTEYSWLTDDIWFEKNGEKVAVLQSDSTYDVCVRVRNRGMDSSPNNATLYVHWTKAQIGGIWPDGWISDFTHDCNGTPVPRGEQIGYEVLPSIGSGESYVAKIPWTTPNSNIYGSCSEFALDNLDGLWHYCVLARIVDDQEQPDESITNLDLRDFVLDYNNVVSRNVTIMSVQNEGDFPKLEGYVALVNPKRRENSGPYTLHCRIDGQIDWEHLANVRLSFGSRFINAQTYLTNQNSYTNNTSGSFDLLDSALFKNIYFDGNDEALYLIKLEVIYYDTYDEGQYPEFDIYLNLWDDSQAQLVGGEQFRFRNANSGSLHIVRHTTSNDFAENINPLNIPIEDAISIDVYDVHGQFLKHCNHCDVKSIDLPNGIYILYIQTETQSYKIKMIK